MTLGRTMNINKNVGAIEICLWNAKLNQFPLGWLIIQSKKYKYLVINICIWKVISNEKKFLYVFNVLIGC